jgi:16S rRNA (cytosine967-C5)-methyltransferase
VLVDVPCSGLGALRRRPEARWRRTLADVEALRSQQVELLRSALDAVRPGGLVAYVTCSPHLRETRSVVDEAVNTSPGIAAERIDVRPYLPGVDLLGDGPDVQLWPHRHGTDAMYIALLRRDLP